MTRTAWIAAAALTVVGAGAAQADDVAPLAGRQVVLNDTSGTVYYTSEASGFRVVATMTASEGTAPIRFVATLADGQSITVSVPTEGAGEPKSVAISRYGDALSVEEIEPMMVRASLE